MQRNWTYLPGRHDMNWDGPGRKIVQKDASRRKRSNWRSVPFPFAFPSAFLQGGLILKYTYTPWPQVQSRLGQVGTRIPQSDQKKHMGDYHVQRLRPSFVNQSRQQMMTAELLDLSDLYSLLRLSKALPSDTLAILRSFHEAGLADMELA